MASWENGKQVLSLGQRLYPIDTRAALRPAVGQPEAPEPSHGRPARGRRASSRAVASPAGWLDLRLVLGGSAETPFRCSRTAGLRINYCMDVGASSKEPSVNFLGIL